MKLSSIDRRQITSQTIDRGALVTVFSGSLFSDGTPNHPAGTLYCEPVTDSRGMEAESIYSESCTRTVDGQKITVWDKGRFVPA